jgi:hypothetical protein
MDSPPLTACCIPEALPSKVIRKRAIFKNAAPSKFCHICYCRLTATRRAVCANIRRGTCRKVICDRCLVDTVLCQVRCPVTIGAASTALDAVLSERSAVCTAA